MADDATPRAPWTTPQVAEISVSLDTGYVKSGSGADGQSPGKIST